MSVKRDVMSPKKILELMGPGSMATMELMGCQRPLKKLREQMKKIYNNWVLAHI